MADGPDFQRVIALFHAAAALQAAARTALLDEKCGGNAALRAEVESLLAADAAAGGFLETPAAIVAGLVDGQDTPLSPGARVGQYVIEREIGRGGMSTVYLAEDERLGRKAAVKVLKAEFTRNPTLRERLRREARAAASLAHPGIATVYSLEEIDDQLCLVAEYVGGETLRAVIERGAAAPDTVIDMGIQVAHALAAAHAAGVVHRDLKPENLMRDAAGRVRILDFGIAHIEAGPAVQRLTGVSLRMGTPGYMSPEQLEGAEVDGRSDIFALGVVLYELASGRHPFARGGLLTAAPSSLAATNATIPVGLERIIFRCLCKTRGDRYGSASEVAAVLEALRADRLWPGPVPRDAARPGGDDTLPAPALPSRWTPPQRWWLFHQLTVMTVAAVMVWPVALVYGTMKSDWTLALLLAVIATAAVNGTLRAHLLFLAALGIGALQAQLSRSVPWLQRSDRLFAALLLVSAVPTARSHLVRSAILAAVAVGWIATSVVIEPATRRAAFPGSDEA